MARAGTSGLRARSGVETIPNPLRLGTGIRATTVAGGGDISTRTIRNSGGELRRRLSPQQGIISINLDSRLLTFRVITTVGI